jgi:predicted nucleic acid-binding protein
VGFSQLDPAVLYDNAVVVDNSVCMRWLFDDGSAKDKKYAKQVLENIDAQSSQVLVPFLWIHEAAFVVNFYVNSESVELEKCVNHLNSLFHLCTVVSTESEPSEVFEFSNHNKISAYNAAYLMLAQQQGCPIATLDKKMTKVAESISLDLY